MNWNLERSQLVLVSLVRVVVVYARHLGAAVPGVSRRRDNWCCFSLVLRPSPLPLWTSSGDNCKAGPGAILFASSVMAIY